MNKNIGKLLICIGIFSVILTGCGSATPSDNKSSTNVGFNADIAGAQSNSVDGFFSSSSGNMTKGESIDYDYSYSESYDYEVPESGYNDSSKPNNSELTLVEEKLVYRCTIGIETLTYSETLTKLNELIEQYNGLIQYSYETDRDSSWYYNEYMKTTGTLRSNLTVRVPSSNYKQFVEALSSGDYGKVRSKTSSIDNISQEYYSTEIEVAALEKEQELLMNMMEQAYDISDVLEIESRLSDVNTRLMKLKTNITYMDMDVAYSYVDISVDEVVEYSEDTPVIKKNTFLDRLYNQFMSTWYGLLDNLESVLFLIIALLPYIVIIAIIILVYKFFLKNKIERIKEKRKTARNKSGNLSLKDMNEMINELNNKLKDEDKK